MCDICDNLINGSECSCWCKCGFPHSQCVCDFTEEDFKKMGYL